MANGINLGKAYVQIMPSAEGISGSISSVLSGEATNAGESAGKSFSSSFGGILKGGMGLAAAGIGTAISGSVALGKTLLDNAKSSAAFGDNVDKLSQKIGISKTAFQEWDYVFSQNGTDISILQTGMKTLSSALADAGNGSKSAIAKFDALGLSVEQLSGLSQEDLFSAVVNQLQGMESGAERTSIAADLLGKSATELGPLLNQTAEDTQKLKDQAHDLGMIMSDEAVASSAAFTDSMDNLSRAFAGAKNIIGAELLPGLTEVTNGLANLVAGNQGAADQISAGFSSIATSVTSAIPGIITTIASLAGSLASVAPDILSALSTGILDALPELAPVATDLIVQLAQLLIQMAPELLSVGFSVLGELALGIADALPELVPVAVDTILSLVEFLTDPNNIGLLVDAAIAITVGLAEGLINALPKLLEKAPIIVANLVTALINNSEKLIMAAGTLIVSLATGLIKNLPKILESAGKIIVEIVKGVTSGLSKMLEIGGKIIGKVKEGISKLNPLDWGKDLIKNFVNGIMSGISWVGDAVGHVADKVRSFLGFSEPEDGPLSNFHTFAPDMMKLFAQGIDQNVGVVMNSVDNMGNQIEQSLADDLSAPISVTGRSAAGRAAGMNSVSMGGVTINVYGAQGQDERVIAQRVSEILNRQVMNSRAVFA